MKNSMKRFALPLLLFFTTAIYSQCPFTVNLNTTGNCLGATLNVTTTNDLSKIVWYNGSNAVSTVTATPVTAGKTVAGNGVTFPNPFGGAFYGLYVDPGGNMYVTDPASSRILKFAAGSTTPVTVAGGNGRGSAANQFSEPWSVYVDVGGNIYVTDFNNSRIQKWAPGATTGVTVAGGNGPGSNANQLNLPGGVFVDATGNVYVADRFNHRIQKWAPGATSGVTVAGGNGLGSGANQFNSPQGIFIDGTGNLYITDMGNNRVQKWAPGATSGVTVAGGNGYGSAANQLQNPWGVFVDADGNVYVTDGHRVQKWAAGANSGTTVAGGNGYGSAANQLTSPTNVWVDVNGNIYIADGSNTRVQLWSQQPINKNYTPTVAGTYSATVTDNNGCTVSTNAINIYPSVTPTINIGTSATTIDVCTPATFNASVTNEGTSPSYQWQVNGVNVGANNPVYTASGLANGSIVTCILTSNAQCAVRSTATSNSITITVQPPVTPAVSIVASTTISCAGSPVTFTARPLNGGSTPLFEWQVNGINTGVTGNLFTTNTLVDKDAVTCIMTSNANCITTTTANSNAIVLTVNSGTPIPVSITSSATTICSGIPVSFTATVPTTGATPVYQWQVNGTITGSNSSSYMSSNLANGDVIRCITTNTNGCEPFLSNDISVVVYPTPHVEAQTIYISAGETITLHPVVSGKVAQYQWSPGMALSDTSIANPIASPVTSIVYTLQVSTADGCKASGEISVQVSTKLGIPNAFTPNGDGKNDIFYIKGGQVGSRISDFSIYNRWGQKIFQQHNVEPGDPAFGWNGTCNGMSVAAGTYAYTITIRLKDGSQQVVRGAVVLIR